MGGPERGASVVFLSSCPAGTGQWANVDKADKYGYTPLLEAAYKGHTDVGKLLLNAEKLPL